MEVEIVERLIVIRVVVPDLIVVAGRVRTVAIVAVKVEADRVIGKLRIFNSHLQNSAFSSVTKADKRKTDNKLEF